MNTAYLLLGSNLKNPEQQLFSARNLIIAEIGEIINTSSLYATAAWGNTNQPDFLNQVIVVNTDFSAITLMETILNIEANMGRIRTQKNAPREIDIDILFFNNDIIDLPELIVPHPLLQERKFVLIPLSEIAPNYKHPILIKTTQELLEICTDRLDVQKKDIL
ncbi:MAG: 2-amino-4-hydroxy-6-hydroxymethyldihydropteridine diphosphokinase [Sphingobacteriales bacterium]|nr:2-amino-4-hydroxy-6-hydroxymethyldihydropteridine diphosphokinase [Sphingobacteriales bacterium]